jgi:hypothetical protein
MSPGPGKRAWRKGRYPAVCFRMPPEVRAALEESANRECRTLTAELLLRLEYTLSIDHDVMIAHRRAQASESGRTAPL